MLKKYGIEWNYDQEWLVELACFRSPEKFNTGLGRGDHLANIFRLQFPWVELNPWALWIIYSYADNIYLSNTGNAAAGKTFIYAGCVFIDFMADPLRTSVVLTSTTKDSVRTKIWAALKRYYEGMKYPVSGWNLVDSKTRLEAQAGNDLCSIRCVAVKAGSVQKSASDIQGAHNVRVIVLIDEATGTPGGIFHAAANLAIGEGTTYFRQIVIGNASDMDDQHGRACRPTRGWESIVDEDTEWEIPGGVCLHFDGLKSPNVLDPEAKWKGLISRKDLESMKERYTEDSGEWWQFVRGFWASGDVMNKVFSRAMFLKGKAKEPASWKSTWIRICGVDPAYEGGDRCIIRFAKMGLGIDGNVQIEMEDIVEFKAKVANTEEPVHYQVADKIITECSMRKCLHIGIDSTGEGGGTADILQKQAPKLLKGVKLYRCEFGGAASDRLVSAIDTRKCNQIYSNRVTEYWYIFRQFVIAGQIKNLDDKTIREFLAREYVSMKNKQMLETKKVMKYRLGFSPDLPDAAVVLIEVARRLGATVSGGLVSQNTNSTWIKKQKQFNAVFTGRGINSNDPTDW